jgi:hypothetical protein
MPIGALDPVGAIGAYWTEPRAPHPQEVGPAFYRTAAPCGDNM